MKHYIPALLLMGLVLKSAVSLVAQGDSDISFAEATTALTKGLEGVENFEIYEGLPGSFGENDLYVAEKRAKATAQIDGEWFYSKTQEGRLEDMVELQRLLITNSLLRPWGGPKLCGGFHADFAVRFNSGKSTYSVLFCFSCHEARIIRASQPFMADIRITDFRLTTDLNSENFEKLRRLLLKYRKERPAQQIRVSSG